MKYLFIVFAIAFFASANDGCTEISVGINPQVSDSDGISLAIVNNWTVADQVLGLDYFDGSSNYLLAVCNVHDRIQAYDPASGTPTGTLDLDAANTYAWGVGWNNDPDDDTYYVNDFLQSNLYFGSSWTTVPDPAGSNSRGMDFDGTDYWTTNGNGGGLWRFQPGAGQENISIPEVPTQPSGVTVFPYGSSLGIAVTTFTTHNIYFYEWDGSSMSYIGSAACPASSINLSFGLTYAPNGNIFWTYRDTSSAYHIAEFSFTITALERSSWGSIKASF